MAQRKRKKTADPKRGQKVKGGRRRNILYVITSRTAMLIMAALLVVSYVSSYFNPAKFWLLSIFGLCFIPLAIINVILLVWAVRRLSKSFLIPLIALLPAFFFVGRYVQFFSEAEEPEEMQKNRCAELITYNVGRFAIPMDGVQDKNQRAEDIFEFLRVQKPDIVCLQEVWVKDMRTVKAYFRKMMPGYHFRYCLAQSRYGNFGNVTFSRYPITESGKIKFDKSANMAIYTDVQTDSSKIRVYNCHFESYNISLPHIVKALADDRDHTKVLKETGDKLEASIMRRPEQVDKVLNDIVSSANESIVCGDFNDTPMSYTYNKLMKGRKDSFVEAGRGFGATYDFLWPALRIDYALFPESCEIYWNDIQRVDYSDHYPVRTYFQI